MLYVLSDEDIADKNRGECSQVAKNAIKSHGTVLLYPYVCICYVFHVGIDSKFYSKVNRQNM